MRRPADVRGVSSAGFRVQVLTNPNSILMSGIAQDPTAEAVAKIQLVRAQKDPIAEAKAEVQLARAQKDPIAEAAF
eukprot:1033271-Rhodomonas_salina.2